MVHFVESNAAGQENISPSLCRGSTLSVGKSSVMNPNTRPDGYFFVCRLCGTSHIVPEEKAPYRTDGGAYVFWPGDIELGCAEKPGTALYTSADFKPYRE